MTDLNMARILLCSIFAAVLALGWCCAAGNRLGGADTTVEPDKHDTVTTGGNGDVDSSQKTGLVGGDLKLVMDMAKYAFGAIVTLGLGLFGIIVMYIKRHGYESGKERWLEKKKE